MSKLLIDEPPLQVLPSLAEEIGLNEAIILQQIHYWTQKSQNHEEDQDGVERKWVWKTFAEWEEEFPFWSRRTIQRAVQSLRDEGILVVEQLRQSEGDNRNWYAIDYESLPPSSQDDQGGSGQNDQGSTTEWPEGDDKVAKSAPAHNAPTRSETTTETTTESESAPAREEDEAVAVYHDVTERRANNVQKDYIATRVEDLDWWREVVKDWIASDYNAGNVKGMLDVYENGWRDDRKNGQPSASDYEIETGFH